MSSDASNFRRRGPSSELGSSSSPLDASNNGASTIGDSSVMIGMQSSTTTNAWYEMFLRKTHRGNLIFVIPGYLIPLVSASVVFVTFFLCLLIAMSVHYKKIVSNEWFGPKEEFFPSVSATIGDYTPERNVFVCGMLVAAFPRLFTALLSTLAADRELNTMIHHARDNGHTLPSKLYKLLVYLSGLLGFLRLVAAAGWISIPSNHNLDYHMLSMTVYYIISSIYSICQIIVWAKIGRTWKSALWKAGTFGLQLGSLALAGYFLYRHKVLREPGAYSWCAVFEWMIIVADSLYEGGVAMDVTGFELEVKHTGVGLASTYPSSSMTDSTRAATESLVVSVEKEREVKPVLIGTYQGEFDYFLLLFCDTLTSYLYWSFVHDLSSKIWFFSLVAMDFSGLEIALFGLCAPALLGIQGVRKVAQSYPHLIYFLGSFGVFSASASPASTRLILAALSFMCMSLLVFSAWMSESKERRERMVHGFVLGLILQNSLRMGWLSVNPIYVRFRYSFICWIILLFAVRITATRLPKHERKMLKWPPINSKKADPEYVIPALGFGGAYFIIHWLLSNYGVISRWVSLPPFPHGILQIFALITGFLLTRTQFPYKMTWFYIMLLGGVLILYGGPWIGFLGGLIITVCSISTFHVFIHGIANLPPGKTGLTFGLYCCAKFLASVYLTAFKFLPAGFLLRERTDLLLFGSFALMALYLKKFSSNIEAKKNSMGEEPSTNARVGIFNLRLPRYETLFLLGVIVLLVLLPVMTSRYVNHYVDYAQPEKAVTAVIWNIHFAYDNRGDSSLEKIKQSLIEADAKIIGLLETDSVHPYVGNFDMVEWLAETMHMESDFGPSVLKHTFGCALLSAYPIVESKQLVLPSPEGEIACAIDADINIGGKIIKVLVGHFGNTEDVLDRQLQTEAFVDIVTNSKYPVIMLSYITTEPYTENYQKLIDSGLKDSAPDYMDRLCQYIMYKDLLLSGFTRLTHGIISDTELEIGRFVIDEETVKTYTSPKMHPLQVMVDYAIPKDFTYHDVLYDVFTDNLERIRENEELDEEEEDEDADRSAVPSLRLPISEEEKEQAEELDREEDEDEDKDKDEDNDDDDETKEDEEEN